MNRGTTKKNDEAMTDANASELRRIALASHKVRREKKSLLEDGEVLENYVEDGEIPQMQMMPLKPIPKSLKKKKKQPSSKALSSSSSKPKPKPKPPATAAAGGDAGGKGGGNGKRGKRDEEGGPGGGGGGGRVASK